MNLECASLPQVKTGHRRSADKPVTRFFVGKAVVDDAESDKWSPLPCHRLTRQPLSLRLSMKLSRKPDRQCVQDTCRQEQRAEAVSGLDQA